MVINRFTILVMLSCCVSSNSDDWHVGSYGDDRHVSLYNGDDQHVGPHDS